MKRIVMAILTITILTFMLSACSISVSEESESSSQKSDSTILSSVYAILTESPTPIPTATPIPTPTPEPTPSPTPNPMDIIGSEDVQYPSQNDEFKYTVYDSYVEITDYNGPTGVDVVVPTEIDGFPVWVIGREAFSEAEVNSVQLPDGLVSIGVYTFEYSSLSQIYMPNSLRTIGPAAFLGCEYLTDINIPKNVERISENAFEGCDNLTNVTIERGVKEIGGLAFSGTGIVSMELPDSIEMIDGRAFSGCANLISVNIPGRVKQLQEGVFYYCENLSEVTLEEGIESLDIADTLYGVGIFNSCSSLESIIVPKSVNYIGRDALDGWRGDITILNPNAELSDNMAGRGIKGKSLTVHGYIGSTAAQYCADNDIRFEVISNS